LNNYRKELILVALLLLSFKEYNGEEKNERERERENVR